MEQPRIRPEGHDSLKCQRTFAGRVNGQPLPFGERCHVCDQAAFRFVKDGQRLHYNYA